MGKTKHYPSSFTSSWSYLLTFFMAEVLAAIFKHALLQISSSLPFAEVHLPPGLRIASKIICSILCWDKHWPSNQTFFAPKQHTIYNIQSPLTSLRTPGMSAIQTVGHTIFVDRCSDQSRRAALQNIVARVVSPLSWPKVTWDWW